MAEYEQAVFISYAWGAEREDIVNEIDETLQQRGMRIVRDKRALGYKGSIKEFMERIGQGRCVIVVISDKYLRSANCMFELVEIAENKQFHDRVFPVVLSDANIYDPIKRIEYVKHWEAKRKELAKAMKTLDPANLQGIRDDMDQYDRIRDQISGITSTLKDMNTLTPDIHRDSEFSNLYDAIVKRMEETSTTDVTTEFNELAKKAEEERRAKEEADRLVAQKTEAERVMKEKAETEQLAQAMAETERKARAEKDQLAAQKAEEERIAQEKAEAERLAAQKAEEERIGREKAVVERLAQIKAEEERKFREEANRLAAQKIEVEGAPTQKTNFGTTVIKKSEIDSQVKEATERLAAQKTETDRLSKQRAEEAVAKVEAERQARESANRLAAQKAEEERQAEKALVAQAKIQTPATAPVKKKSNPIKWVAGIAVTGVVVVAIVAIAVIGYGAFFGGDSTITDAPVVDTPSSEAALVIPVTGATSEPTATEKPSATEAPIATEKPTAKPQPTYTEITIPAAESKSFSMKFDGNSDLSKFGYFQTGDGNENKLKITLQNNGLEFLLNDANLWVYYIYQPQTYKDVVVKLRAENTGTINKNNISLVCRQVDKTWYEFSVTNGGLWYLYEHHSNEYNTITNGGTNALNLGQSVNDYEMRCIGTNISLYVNGVLIKTVSNNLYKDGRAGFNISSLDVYPIQVLISKLEVSEP